MGRTLNLDAKRAARSEAENEPHTLVLGGEEFKLPPRVPLLFVERLAAYDVGGAMVELLDEAWPKFAAHKPELDDLIAIARELYGLEDFFAQPSSASPPSSNNGGQSARPTSKPTTASTSRRAATAPAMSASAGSSPS